jgi:hypothetical protein
VTSVSKLAGLLLIAVLAVSSLIVVESAFAQSIPKPSVPEFTLKFVDNSYDVPTTYSTDPYTGATVTHSGYHVQNRTVEVNIKNQPFTKYEADGQIIDFYLNIRMKGNYAEDWIDIYSPSRGFLTRSESEYTKIAYSLYDNEFPFWENFGQSGVVDFQVEALIGSVHRIINGSATNILQMAPWIFEGEESGWSNTQTLTISASSSPNSTSPTSPDQTTERATNGTSQTWQFESIIGTVIAVVIGAGVLVYFKKRKRQAP